MTAIFGKGGAMEALMEMKDQKVVRFLGVTGHYRPEALIDPSTAILSMRFLWRSMRPMRNSQL